jgi:hypothetical protein
MTQPSSIASFCLLAQVDADQQRHDPGKKENGYHHDVPPM